MVTAHVVGYITGEGSYNNEVLILYRVLATYPCLTSKKRDFTFSPESKPIFSRLRRRHLSLYHAGKSLERDL